MKCLKKFLALGMCAGVMSTSSCSAVLPDEVMEFYLSTGMDEVILKSSEGLRAICHFLNGGYGPNLIGQTALENYLSQVHEQARKNNDDLKSLRNHLAAHLEGIRETASSSFKLTVGGGEAKSAVSIRPTSLGLFQDDFSPFVVIEYPVKDEPIVDKPKKCYFPSMGWVLLKPVKHLVGRGKLKSEVFDKTNVGQADMSQDEEDFIFQMISDECDLSSNLCFFQMR